MGINDLAFVGWPVFVREDGTWRRRRRPRRKKMNKGRQQKSGHHREGAGEEETTTEGEEDDPTTTTTAEREDVDPPEKEDTMTMFNVVFVLDPPLLEYSARTCELYDNVIKKFAKALKWEQARTNYVWKESQKILHIKEIAKEKRM